jgi:hypothetical protein
MRTNSDRLSRCILRSIVAIGIALLFGWFVGDFANKYLIVLYCLTYLFLYVKDVAGELTERLKQLGGYIEDDSEFEDADAEI